ncbi:MAG: flagellar hook-length control protein FliK [Planctomycetota bacterium]|jgi:flagellar hook-length control protein FliK|nr:flagellar hook-length control protein FliK [Planctomycetota bacterium]
MSATLELSAGTATKAGAAKQNQARSALLEIGAPAKSRSQSRASQLRTTQSRSSQSPTSPEQTRRRDQTSANRQSVERQSANRQSVERRESRQPAQPETRGAPDSAPREERISREPAGRAASRRELSGRAASERETLTADNNGVDARDFAANDAFADDAASFQDLLQNAVEAAVSETAEVVTAEIDPTMLDELEKILESGLLEQLPVVAKPEEVLQKIAVLAADGGLDLPMLAALSSDELAEFAEWLTADAAGLFQNFAFPAAEAAPKIPAFFAAADTLTQLDRLQKTVAATPIKDTALIGELAQLSDLSPLETDRLAQEILRAVAAAADGDEAADLRQRLTPVDAAELTKTLNAALQKIAETRGQDLPPLPDALPEIVVKSLAVEIINVNNAALDAADQQLSLLDGLNRNAALRAALLQQVASDEKLTAAVSGEKLAANLAQKPELTAALTAEVALPEADLTGEADDADEAAENPETAALTEEELPVAEKPRIGTPVDKQSPSATENKLPAAKNAPTVAANAEQLADAATALSTEPSAKNSTPPQAAQPAKKTALDLETEAEVFAGEAELTGATDEIPSFENRPAAPTLTVANVAANAAPTATAPANEPATRQAVLQENVNRLAELMESARSTGQTLKSLTLALNPPELGKVTVELELTPSGGVSATVRAENDTARNLLLSGLDALRKSLEAKGVSLEQFNVELGGKDAGQQNAPSQGGDWFGAMSDERDRRARQNANQLRYGNRGHLAEPEPASAPRVRAGSSFELIA